MLSIVCPFYNENAILERSVEELLRNLEELPEDWELIIVNDGSTDGSADTARRLDALHPRLRVVSYESNKGRGHALRAGIEAARGRCVFTTEIDLSWGDDIVMRMFRALEQEASADMVIASPHLPGGGYRNVPFHRVFLSKYGNLLIRMGMSFSTTMNTGMTRGYRIEAIRSLPLYEDGKEFHLEVILKALSAGLRIVEIPAILEWKANKQGSRTVKRVSSSRINKLIGSHMLFSVFAAPIRYLWGLSGVALIAALGSGLYGLWRYAHAEPYADAILGFIGFSALTLLFFSFGVLSQQNRLLMQEIWRLQGKIEREAFREPTDRARSD
jgi:glycosyltransferase involved in cell wall biosynthesis